EKRLSECCCREEEAVQCRGPECAIVDCVLGGEFNNNIGRCSREPSLIGANLRAHLYSNATV
uniref:Uncharacterized protein n=1 Tax=Anopheles dirus TaxID=7168 RepID=A0A182NVS9_9DIPT